ncbi:EF-hand superfamily Ca2+-modulated protein [Eremomyces bilateralis CBS 781.70]|uniref:EF-hand superfamily Ca2+-modulated protein n=1 Tax=Eremomyces bilateralis CBS 781.70 TaxID=1392243 RepID=A0A6G1GAD0_9PEZI|nr:EF-hand superfamily Ca2+-modulated protein [Eremomyces bilateralis CBS 781.70]KAF1814896.1 EF-hand superfamily Ca2+-modulated protein [Eremomyces bilateralis CBS 781.70]
MAPKRKQTTAVAGPSTTHRASKLAKEHNITGLQESSIREAYSLFAIQHPNFAEERQGVLRGGDVRRCLLALNLPYSADYLSALDPDASGFVTFDAFFGLAALLYNDKENPDEDDEEGSADDEPSTEAQEAFRLFNRNTGGPITLSHLRRVARELREDVDEATLQAMLVEANGEAEEGGWKAGVSLEEFDAVMKRAGVFG